MRINRKRVAAKSAGIVVLTVLASGLANTVAAQDVPADLVGVWKVETISGAAVDPQVDAWLEFEEAGTVDGSGGCNSLFGPFSNDDGFRIGPLAATRKACPPDILTQEQALIKAIPAVRDFRLRSDNQELQLLNGAGDVVVRLSADK